MPWKSRKVKEIESVKKRAVIQTGRKLLCARGG